MDRLNLLGVALGLACLAGINLYLTVFVTGLAIHFHWITLGPAYQSLEVLGHPAVIIVSGILYFLEFFADKIPWVDSAWDAVHTVIRPIGGALLAIQVLGHPSPAFTVIVALLAGGTSLVTHTAKSATRRARADSLQSNPRFIDLRSGDRNVCLFCTKGFARHESKDLARI